MWEGASAPRQKGVPFHLIGAGSTARILHTVQHNTSSMTESEIGIMIGIGKIRTTCNKHRMKSWAS
jgi:hypothetical protein